MGSISNTDANPAAKPRIDLVDALRATALLGLFLLHCVEHFELGRGPESAPLWLEQLDRSLGGLAFLLFSGKAYGIFACLFGLSFFLQLRSAESRGEDGRLRFVWRLFLLGVIGYLFGVILSGDILLIIAVLGLPLVLLYKLKKGVLAVVAALLLLQLPELYHSYQILFKGAVAQEPVFWGLYGRYTEVYAHGSFRELVALNAFDGQALRFWFTYESGRYLQMSGLFVCGLLLGRTGVFEDPRKQFRFGLTLLLVGVVALALFWPVLRWSRGLELSGPSGYVVHSCFGSYTNLAQAMIWVGTFVLLYQLTVCRAFFDWFAPFGRTSLTTYVVQGLFWVPLYYGFGFGLYRYLGTSLSLLVGLPFILLQVLFSRLWLKHFRYGPLEWLWRAATRLDFSIPLRRTIQKA